MSWVLWKAIPRTVTRTEETVPVSPLASITDG
jgi:hypothetical protein